MSSTPARMLMIITLGAATLPLTGCDGEWPLVLPHSETAEDAYEDLTQEWIRWVMLIPHSTSPIADPTGEHCALGQTDGRWFLAGTYGGPVERECTIPAHTPLFFPLINRWSFASDEWVAQDPGNLDAFVDWMLGYQADSRASTCELVLRLDGEDILDDTAERDEELYVAITEPFAFELDDDNVWVSLGHDVPGGSYSYMLADGHWALFRPLPPGDYELELGGKTCDAEGGVVFETSAVYHLHVEDED